MTIEEQIKKVLAEYGAIGENWKVQIKDQKTSEASDWTFVYVDCIRPRCRKAVSGWKLAINTVKGICYFDQSEHWNY